MAVLYFITFIGLSAFLVINIFVAVVLKNFEIEMSSDPDTNDTLITKTDVEKFCTLWAKNTVQQHRDSMAVEDFVKHFLFALDSPWSELIPGVDPVQAGDSDGNPKPIKEKVKPSKSKRVVLGLQLLNRLDVPCIEGRIHYMDAITKLSQDIFRPPRGTPGYDYLRRIPGSNEMLKAIQEEVFRKYPILKKHADHVKVTAAEQYAYDTLAKAFLRHKEKKQKGDMDWSDLLKRGKNELTSSAKAKTQDQKNGVRSLSEQQVCSSDAQRLTPQASRAECLSKTFPGKNGSDSSSSRPTSGPSSPPNLERPRSRMLVVDKQPALGVGMGFENKQFRASTDTLTQQSSEEEGDVSGSETDSTLAEKRQRARRRRERMERDSRRQKKKQKRKQNKSGGKGGSSDDSGGDKPPPSYESHFPN